MTIAIVIRLLKDQSGRGKKYWVFGTLMAKYQFRQHNSEMSLLSSPDPRFSGGVWSPQPIHLYIASFFMKIGDKQVEMVLKKCNFGTKLIFSIFLILEEIWGGHGVHPRSEIDFFTFWQV